MSAITPAAVRSARASGRLLAVLALAAGVAQAQGAAVAAGEAPDLETGRAATAAIGRQLGTIDPRVSDLRMGRGGILCGSVDVRNRMGDYTGPRPFVFEPGTGVAGRLPEGPELRNPASMAAYRAMERARALFAAHCIDRSFERKDIPMRYRPVFLAGALLVAAGPAAHGQEAGDISAEQRNAARLAGLVGFVNVHCGTLRSDAERFKGAVRSMGVDPAELDRDALMLQARGYLAAYAKDVPASCARAEELFGQRGRIIPGIFVPR